jgi:ferric-dicitrate binding protein FerR (iron transport regulator)
MPVTRKEPFDRERAQALMMAAMDGEISPADRRELDQLIVEQPDLAAEWQRFVRLKEVTAGMSLSTPPEETWDRYWASTYRRTERAVGWILLSAGAVVLAGYWLWNAVEGLLADTGTPVAIRAAIAAVGLGLVILAVGVVREKLFTARRDPYQKEISR